MDKQINDVALSSQIFSYKSCKIVRTYTPKTRYVDGTGTYPPGAKIHTHFKKVNSKRFSIVIKIKNIVWQQQQSRTKYEKLQFARLCPRDEGKNGGVFSYIAIYTDPLKRWYTFLKQIESILLYT